ncbi:MAG: hypothetical protein C0501_07070 [Isosphaera sp.]|nr:hypothetical protein [Isosphaera sp.]
MPIHIHDAASAAVLSAATGEDELLGPDGRVLGRFVPAPKMSFPEVGLTDEELEQGLNDPNAVWHTPEEVMARLREIDRCSP